jgi:hypothetical protein
MWEKKEKEKYQLRVGTQDFTQREYRSSLLLVRRSI